MFRTRDPRIKKMRDVRNPDYNHPAFRLEYGARKWYEQAKLGKLPPRVEQRSYPYA
jgi:hypothetical protein